MKKTLLIAVIISSLVSCGSEDSLNTPLTQTDPTIYFVKELYMIEDSIISSSIRNYEVSIIQHDSIFQWERNKSEDWQNLKYTLDEDYKFNNILNWEEFVTAVRISSEEDSLTSIIRNTHHVQAYNLALHFVEDPVGMQPKTRNCIVENQDSLTKCNCTGAYRVETIQKYMPDFVRIIPATVLNDTAIAEIEISFLVRNDTKAILEIIESTTVRNRDSERYINKSQMVLK